MWAIRDDRSKRFFNGVDAKYTPPRPRLTLKRVKLYRNQQEALDDLPDDGEDYELIRVRFEPVGRIQRRRTE